MVLLELMVLLVVPLLVVLLLLPLLLRVGRNAPCGLAGHAKRARKTPPPAESAPPRRWEGTAQTE